MATRLRTLILILLLIGASFGSGFYLSSQNYIPTDEGASSDGTGPADQTAATTTTSTTARPTETTTETTTTETTVDLELDESDDGQENPWGEDVLIVGLDDSNATRDVKPLIRETLDYWEKNDDQYGDYQINFSFRPNAVQPDIRIRMLNSLPRCADEDDDVDSYLGCAPLLEEGTTAYAPEYVDIVVGYDNETTLTTLKHEFGHVLGIEHGEEPMPIMAEVQVNAARQPLPDVKGQRYTFKEGHVDVYVDLESFDAPAARVNEQVGHAISFYNNSANGNVPPLLVVDRTHNRSEAEIVIKEIEGRLECLDEPRETGSCGPMFGYDPDRDGALEYYTNQTITIKNVDTEKIGWHVGFHMSFALNPDEEFYPFESDAPEDLRQDWWRRVN